MQQLLVKELPSQNCTEVVLVGSEESDDPYGHSENPAGTGLDWNLDVTAPWRRKVTRNYNCDNWAIVADQMVVPCRRM